MAWMLATMWQVYSADSTSPHSSTTSTAIPLIHRSSGSAVGYADARAEFLVAGAPHQNYAITLPRPTEIETAAGSLVLDKFTDSEGGTGSLDAEGGARFAVGVKLVLTSDQPIGTYRGSFPVSVDYY